jgi:hypothetical protein
MYSQGVRVEKVQLITLTKLNIVRVGESLGEIVQLITDYSNLDTAYRVGS